MKKNFFVFLLLLSGSFLSAESRNKEVREPVLLIEPAALHPPIADLIPGAKKTVITAGFLEKKESGTLATISFLEPSWKTTRVFFMNPFLRQARNTLSKRLAGLHPQFLRDEHEVIQVAIIDNPSPITASTILAPDFAQQFIPIFGPVFLVALPTTHRIYIFSKLASPLASIGATIRDDYQLSLSPLTLEIFELGKGEIHAVGSLE
ncbi:MAG: hypothetical protein K2W99_04395 [Chthoniobacterales bacterium]|nr:hypothetical protein [Chthoniobacterales bacterium]